MQDLAYVAGLFDADGCTTLAIKNKPNNRVYKYVNLDITQDNKETLNEVYKIIQLGHIRGPYHYPPNPRKPFWKLGLFAQGECLTLLEAMWPFLGEIKKQQAINVMAASTVKFPTFMNVPAKFLTKEEAWAWATGFWVGDGTIFLDSRRNHLAVKAHQSHPAILETYNEIVQKSKVTGPHTKDTSYGPTIYWEHVIVDQDDCREVLNQFLPYLKPYVKAIVEDRLIKATPTHRRH